MISENTVNYIFQWIFRRAWTIHQCIGIHVDCFISLLLYWFAHAICIDLEVIFVHNPQCSFCSLSCCIIYKVLGESHSLLNFIGPIYNVFLQTETVCITYGCFADIMYVPRSAENTLGNPGQKIIKSSTQNNTEKHKHLCTNLLRI